MKAILLGSLIATTLALFPAYAAEKVEPVPVNTTVEAQAVNINTATAEQLSQLKGIGANKAMAIIEYRNTHGKFTDINQLSEVKGIGPKLLEQNRANIKL